MFTAGSSRIAKLLHELDLASDTHRNHRHFADKLGRLLDLSDAFALSDALRGLSRTPLQSPADSVIAIREDFLSQRQALIQAIGECFTGHASTGMPILPPANAETLRDDSKAFEPYRRFYALQQSELELHCRKLRSRVRRALAGLSPRLAQLAALDSALGDTLLPQMRHYHARIPHLLGMRFTQLRYQHREQLAGDPQQWTEPGGWLKQFYQDMQNLLLAELELRLQTVIGLIEALDEENDTHD